MASATARSATVVRSPDGPSESAAALRPFLDSNTPLILRLIRRAGVRGRDEAMDVYVRVCEHLERDGCARLAAYDAGRGTLVSWLAVVVRRVAIDWIRSRAGRRRHFAAIRRLGPLERGVFELQYWEASPPGDLAASLTVRLGRPVRAHEVDAALERVERTLDDRQRAELCATISRTRPALSIDRPEGDAPMAMPDPRPDPEARLLAAEVAGELARLLALLPSEDLQILQLKYAHGCSHREISRELGVEVSDDRVRRAVARLRALIGRRGLSYAALDRPGVRFLTTIPLRPWPGRAPLHLEGRA